MTMTFEECRICGKYEMRVESRLVYSKSHNIFFKVWECFSCNHWIYEEIEFKDMENAESKKLMCILFQNWNENAVIYNKKHFNK